MKYKCTYHIYNMFGKHLEDRTFDCIAYTAPRLDCDEVLNSLSFKPFQMRQLNVFKPAQNEYVKIKIICNSFSDKYQSSDKISRRLFLKIFKRQLNNGL